MKVYVLQHVWNTPNNDGFEVLGVYSEDHINQARADMLESINAIKQEFIDTYGEDWKWDEDVSCEDGGYVHLSYDPKQIFTEATVYSWEILSMEVR